MRRRSRRLLSEGLREQRCIDRERLRERKVANEVLDMQADDATERERTHARREDERRKRLLQQKLEIADKNTLRRLEEDRHLRRERRHHEVEEDRAKKEREKAFLNKAHDNSGFRKDEEDEDEEAEEVEDPLAAKDENETKEFQKLLDQEERDKRADVREAKKAAEEAKRASLEQLSGPNRDLVEGTKALQRKAVEEAERKSKEDKRLAVELAMEAARRAEREHAVSRVETFREKEPVREVEHQKREAGRHAAVTKRCHGIPLGSALPNLLSF